MQNKKKKKYDEDDSSDSSEKDLTSLDSVAAYEGHFARKYCCLF